MATGAGTAGIVASGHADTSAAACEVLAAGGNAFDAALAALAASTVCEPMLTSLGGGGYLMARPAGQAPVLFDFFVQTPAQKQAMDKLDFYPILADFGTAKQEFHVGLGAMAVPGMVAGLFAVHEQLGSLPMAEILAPAIDPFAYSSGRALGAWQFLASTGRQYGLAQNAWYDGRRDVWAATEAALDYLQYLEGFFDGDWLLALAAYNAGEGRVGRSVKRNLAAGEPGDYWSIRLPKETRGYVPKLMGLACLFRDAEGYGFEPPATPNQQVIDRFSIGKSNARNALVKCMYKGSLLSGLSICIAHWGSCCLSFRV